MPKRYVNSVKSRVKEPKNVADKIVRKAASSLKYDKMDINNFHLYLDDLLGMRIILLYVDDWYNIHEYIKENFYFDVNNYKIKSKRQDIDSDKPFIIEKPEIKIRHGDNEKIFTSHFPVHDFPYEIIRNDEYRSIHYTLYYKGYCFELQVRSIFDEAWSEIHHNLLYPNLSENSAYKEYSKFINRLSGLSNEMSSYLKKILIPYLNICEHDSEPFISDFHYEKDAKKESIDEEKLNIDSVLNKILKR